MSKLCFEERLEQIKACAEDPYNNHWYMEADSPWSALLNIFEMNDALKLGKIY